MTDTNTAQNLAASNPASSDGTGESTQGKLIRMLANDIKPGTPAEQITSETSLFDDLLLDSIQLIELVTRIESEFDIDMDDEDLDFQFFATVDTLTEFVNNIITR